MAVGSDGKNAHKIGETQEMKATCDSRTQDPSEQLYWSATGIKGNGSLFVWTRSKILYYSLGCDGVGIAQIAADGSKSSVVNPAITHARLSGDGTQLLGVTGDGTAAKLVRVNLGDGTVTELTTAAPPDQVAWSPDSKVVYYSTTVSKKTLILNDDAQKEHGLRAFGVWPFQTTIYDISLHSIDLASGTDTQLFSNTGRAIVNIA